MFLLVKLLCVNSLSQMILHAISLDSKETEFSSILLLPGFFCYAVRTLQWHAAINSNQNFHRIRQGTVLSISYQLESEIEVTSNTALLFNYKQSMMRGRFLPS